ncbi:hypothetical protein ABB37_08445 [Leptomonas pyrrhocoris]|uniref:Trafficking protein particle complex subunit 13 N-terminal domain-containing protein n=1 Tax=Leptomonas pyrrhocoris TaxID=157538 RepID=A0A0M9FTE0_LEPPY|nr:hypothetical protein ABB37_08445 [Leptomonas pyrrhocoris]KPA75559.1 hypothetical protein ABB37_08445 [Leptomonas pyrrhocoris]|eukprot:XP_015653998.1 hypothetical protein ABB37_08445 [Leptomonas pyrrhocoris]
MHATPPVTVRVGAASPVSAAPAGATGRVTAGVTSASASAAAANVGSAPKPGVVSASIAAAPAVVTAPDGTVMLSAPLGLQASVLSQPSFYPSLGEDMGDLAEEGDILFSVLGDPWSRVRGEDRPGNERASTTTAVAATTTTVGAEAPVAESNAKDVEPAKPAEVVASPLALPAAAAETRTYPLSSSLSASSSTALCVQPVLTLPRKIGVALACEVFRALLCFHNAATYPLAQAHFHIGVAQPPAPLRRPLLRRTLPALPAKSNYTIVASVPLHEVCSYSLAVTVEYNDPSGRQRQLSWNSILKTEQPIMEVQQRRLAYLRPCVSMKGKAHASSSPLSRGYACYQLTVGLQNMSSVPLVMTSSELLLPTLINHSGKPLFRNLAPRETGQEQDLPHPLLHLQDATSDVGGRKPSSPAYLMPGDAQTLVFLIGVCLEELRHATVVHGQGGVMTKLLSPRLASFGHVQWTWCRANGEAGTARSAPLHVEQLVAEPDVVLRVTQVVSAAVAGKSAAPATPTEHPASAAAAEAEDPTFAEDAPLSTSPSFSSPAATPLLLLAGSPVTMEFALVNHSSVHRYDVALKVRVERLAPQWLYTGPTVRLLGLLEPSSTLTFSLSVLPWQAGWLQVVQAALEVVDARMPEAVLWPPASTSLLRPVRGQNGSFNSAAAAAAAADGKDSKDGADRPTFAATAPAVAQSAMKATLPAVGDVLCDVLVL